MKHDGTVAMFQYWNELRKMRPAPLRAEIDPSQITSVLADTMLIEPGDTGGIFRLAGTRLCALYGRELKHGNLLDLWSDDDRQMMSGLLKAVFRQNDIVHVLFDGISVCGRATGFEMLLLPLRGKNEGSRIIGTIVPLGTAFWIGSHPIRENRVESVSLIDPDAVQKKGMQDASTTPSIAPHEDSMVLDHPPSHPGRRVRHLRVFEGGLAGR